jgi:iron-sulfur cluster repair protein YtfE (RIC family)
MKSTAILELMIHDHAKLMKYLGVVEKNMKENPEDVISSFRTFEWNLEKHFFVEERAIFTWYNPENVDEGYAIFLDLAKQHTAILEKLRLLKKSIRNIEAIDFTKFKSILIKHKNYEEKNVYPLLDMEINEGEKRFMIERIKEVAL